MEVYSHKYLIRSKLTMIIKPSLEPSYFFDMDLLQHEPPIHAFVLQRRPLVYDFKTTLESLDPAPLITSMQQLQM